MLEELKEQYRLTLPDKISAIKQLLQDLRDGKDGTTEKLRVIAHTLHGSGTTFGYPEISIAARQVEHADNDKLLKQLIHLIRVLVDVSNSKTAPARPSILIIDDDTDITMLLSALLSQKCPGHQVQIATSAAAAEPLLQMGSFALIVLDLVLPDSDGRAILQRLKETSHRNTSVFVLSGVDKASIRDECLALGARKFIPKPFNPNAIADAIAAELTTPEPALPGIGDALPTPAPTPVAAPKAAISVLVADDDELLANVVKHRLTREGFTVTHVTNGAAALAAVEAQPFSLVVLDVKMPMMDGFEVLTNIRKNPARADMPIIMLTAMGSERDVVRGYDLGANDYVLKPFSPAELLAKVKRLLKLG